MEHIHPLAIQISGEAISGANPGWAGGVEADSRFAALLMIRCSNCVWWSKAEVAASGVSLRLNLHPLRDGSNVQFLFSLGPGLVNELGLMVTTETFAPITPARLLFHAAELGTFCTVQTSPVAHFELMFLSHADVYKGRTGVWRPHKRLRGAFPSDLAPMLFGPRRGTHAGG